MRACFDDMACGLGWKPQTVIGMMWAYFDESGEHGPDGKLLRLTLGGFMAPIENVRRLCERWEEALHAEGLGEFHMKHIASDEDHFAGWSPERQNRLARFVDILCEEGVEFGAYSYTGKRRFGLFRELYQSGLNRAYINFASFCERNGQRGHIVFAKTTEISECLVGGYFERLKWGEFLDGYSVQLSRDNAALQAAEIVARVGIRRKAS
jgi:hypothetical protein